MSAGLNLCVITAEHRQNIGIRWAEIIFGNLRRMNPGQIVVFQHLRCSFCDRAVEQGQSDFNIRILVNDLGVNATYLNGDIQLFLTFPDQSLFHSFAGFQFAASVIRVSSATVAVWR